MDENNKLEAGICRVDLRRGGAIIYGDEDFFRLTGYTEGDIQGGRLSMSSLLTDEYRTFTKELLLEAAGKHRSFCVRQPLIKKNGEQTFVHCSGEMEDDSVARVIFTLCNCQNKLEKAYQNLLRQTELQKTKLTLMANSTDDVYFDYEIATDRLSMTASLTRYDLDGDNAIENYFWGKTAKEFIHPDDYPRFEEEYKKVNESPGEGCLDYRTKAFDDDYTWYRINYVCHIGAAGKAEWIFGRISSIQEMKNLATRIDKDSAYIQYLTNTDSLTGLLNRKGFTEKVERLLEKRDSAYVYGVVYSDINDFSYVNENFGYEAGNKMLKDFALCLQETPTDLAGCRIYSDFFVGFYRARTRELLIKSIEQRNVSFTNLQKMRYPASDIRISCGMYILPEGECDVNAAIDNANLARRSIKHTSTIICGIFSSRMKAQKVYEQAICSELHSAIENRHIEMFLQPKFHLETREMIGAEALARWRNDDGTYKMPFEFIPVLEKVGYIDELDFFIYAEALRTLERWQRDQKRLVPVSVNFSQHHIAQPHFAESIISTADNYDVNKAYIEIEITESCFSGDTQTLFKVMDKLRRAGFMVSIDDFGIGYSTLSVLMNAPVDIVKIDKSFIDNIEKSKLERDYVNCMCSLIETAQKDIIFEGVETEAQAQILCSSGYTKAQGWLFDKAIPLESFEKKYMDY